MIGFMKWLVGWLFGFIGREVEKSKIEVIEIDLGAGPVWVKGIMPEDEIEFIRSKKDESISLRDVPGERT